MIYAVNKRTKEHRIVNDARDSNMLHEVIIQADADGWIEWDDSLGAGNPLPEGSRCDIMLDGEDDHLNCNADTEDWDGAEMPSIKITHYRPILNAEEKEMKQEWNGEGLPPVGAEVEYRAGYAEVPSEYSRCTIIAHFTGESGDQLAAFTYKAHDGVIQLGRGAPRLFRPTQTDRDRWIEAAQNACIETPDGEIELVYGALFDAGLAKLPEQTK